MNQDELIKRLWEIITVARFDNRNPLREIEATLEESRKYPKRLNVPVDLKLLFRRLSMYQQLEDEIPIKTGNSALDYAIEGYRKGELVVFAGRPGMGTTDLVINSAFRCSETINVLFLSYELSASGVFKRIMRNQFKISNLEMLENDEQLFDKVNSAMERSNMMIIDERIIDFNEFKETIQKGVHLENVQIVYIDYFQFVSMYLRIPPAQLAFELKKLAYDLEIVIVVLSQLSPDLEFRGGDHRPYLHDLINGEFLEIYADKVFLAYRPAYYGFVEDEKGDPVGERVEVIIAKNNKEPEGNPDSDQLQIRM